MGAFTPGVFNQIPGTVNASIARVLASYEESGYLDSFIATLNGTLYQGSSFDPNTCKGSLLNRNLFFDPNAVKGGCAGVSPIDVPATAGILTGVKIGDAAAGTGLGIADALVSGLAGSALGIALGAVTAGIGLIVGPLIAAIQQKAINIANFETALCTVGLTLAQAIPQIDAAVMSGQVSASQGAAALIALCQACNTLLANKTTKAEYGASAIYRPAIIGHWNIAQKLYADAVALAAGSSIASAPGAPAADSQTTIVNPPGTLSSPSLFAIAIPSGDGGETLVPGPTLPSGFVSIGFDTNLLPPGSAGLAAPNDSIPANINAAAATGSAFSPVVLILLAIAAAFFL